MKKTELIAKGLKIATLFGRAASKHDSEIDLKTFTLTRTTEALAIYLENPTRQKIEVFVERKTGKMLAGCYKPGKIAPPNKRKSRTSASRSH